MEIRTLSRPNIAIIPARGGSKGIAGKNVRTLCGKPLIGWTIEAALASQLVDRVFVSTDDARISQVAEHFGAHVVERPVEISGDTASSESALLHTLEYLLQNKVHCTELTFLQCTAPLTAPEDIDGTVQVMLEQQADSAMAVVPFHYFLWSNTTGSAVGINHDKRIRPLRSEREPQYLEAGAVYVMKAEGFRQARHRFFGKTAMYVMPPERRWEIDDPADWTVAEALMRQREQHRILDAIPSPVTAMVLDFDGVFTDNKVIVSEDGREAVVCDRGDGMGISQILKLDIPMLVLSKERNSVVQVRCNKLGIECCHGIDEKLPTMLGWFRDRGLEAQRAIYVGNDVNDIACMQAVGCGVAVADAHEAVRANAGLVLSSAGGQGAIRELTDLIKQKQERTHATIR